MGKNVEADKGSIVIYKAKGGKAELEVKLEKEEPGRFHPLS